MKLNSAGVVAVVALVALAGCTGFAPGSTPGASPSDDAPETGEPADTTDDDAGATSDSGVVRFYISDERNAIGDFEHLNVTISEVGFRTAGDADADEEETDETPENETTPVENATDTPADNETEIPEDNETEIPEETDEETDDEADESGEWVEHDVDDRTFDLTRLQGDNASLLEEFDVPEGSYEKVFVHVEEIDATLENGESVNVKLPSEKLQLTQDFDVNANSSVDFVFDITVHKAGNSGKYILTPVISESGTDVPIDDVDDDREEDEGEDEEREDEEDDSEEREDEEDDSENDEQEDDSGNDEQEDDSEEEEQEESDDVEMELDASFVGAVEPGENATVQVSSNDSAVANATVTVNGEVVGETDGAGQLTFSVPEDVDEVDVEIESGDAEVELEVEFENAPA